MVQLTLEFENNSIKNRFLKIIELMHGVSVVKPATKTKARKSGLDKAMEDVREGRVERFASSEKMFESLGI